MYNRKEIDISNPSGHTYSIDTNGVVYNDSTKHVLKGRLKGGYHLVCIDQKYRPVHRFVAKAFVPNPENKPYVNHIDGNKQNNHYTNLEWCTHEENMEHARKTGLWKAHMHTHKGTDHGMCKVTEDDVHRICRRISSGKGYNYKVFPGRITRDVFYNIKRRKTWKHISKDYTW